MKKKNKKYLGIIAAFSCAFAIGITANAGTIPFTICVNGSNADTKSKREIKTSDGDTYAYFTATSYLEGSAPVTVASYKLNNTSIKTSTATLKTTNKNVVQKRKYGSTAQGGYYYYMEAGQNPAYAKTKISGRYCP